MSVRYWFIGCLTPSQGVSSLIFLNQLTNDNIDIGQCSASSGNGYANNNAANSNTASGAQVVD
jgi:hypothetical protein